MIKPVGDWYLVSDWKGDEDTVEVLAVPDAPSWPVDVGDMIRIDPKHVKYGINGKVQFIHRNYILGVETEGKGE
jgi:hypothetical protein